MSAFKDGPAADLVLSLRRAPIWLRLVQETETGRWDALDQLDDTPRPGERVHVYRRVGPVVTVFVRPGGRYALADYRHFPQAPADDLRDNGAWRAWAQRAGPEIPTSGDDEPLSSDDRIVERIDELPPPTPGR